MVFSEHSVSAIFFLLFERAAQSCESPFDRKFEKSLGTFDFRDFIIIFVAESLFAFSAALMEFSK